MDDVFIHLPINAMYALIVESKLCAEPKNILARALSLSHTNLTTVFRSHWHTVALWISVMRIRTQRTPYIRNTIKGNQGIKSILSTMMSGTLCVRVFVLNANERFEEKKKHFRFDTLNSAINWSNKLCPIRMKTIEKCLCHFAWAQKFRFRNRRSQRWGRTSTNRVGFSQHIALAAQLIRLGRNYHIIN